MKPLLILLSLATLASARLGETPAECSKRYGDPKETNKEAKTIFYIKSGFCLSVKFHEGKAVKIAIIKGNPNAPEDISEAERESLLKANAGAGEWKKQKQIFDVDPQWNNAEENRVAEYSTLKKILIMGTLDQVAREATEKESAEKENLEGF